ncbi:MAG: hypothetical protein ACREH4_07925 [Vitreimonas sp.]
MTTHSITIAPRFNGPPGSGNGGYVCGLMAARVGGACEASLRAPPPLGVPLTLDATAEGVALRDGDTVIGEARAARLDLTPPPAPSLAEARAAARRYVGLHDHRFPTCFVCGAGRPAHDGLDIFTGPVDGAAMVACVWTPGADLADAAGRVAPEFIHAALDCPSYWALPRAGEIVALLARLTASVDAPLPRVGEDLIVTAWHLNSDVRKHHAAAALYSADGAVIARSRALWIELKS